MAKHITVIVGHPDPSPQRYLRGLASAYAEGARIAGHEVRFVDLANLSFPLLRTQAEWQSGEGPSELREAQQAILWADHIAIFYPLWLGSMPALLKGFLEQVLRPGIEGNKMRRPFGFTLLMGKTARIVVTMGMPAFFYRWYFRAHSLKSLERNVLRYCGIGAIRETLVGMVEAGGPARHERWLEKMRKQGRTDCG